VGRVSTIADAVRSRGGLAALTAAALVLAATTWRSRRPDLTARNVVLVIGCTVRADQTTPYGGGAEVTPFLQALARAGARFEDTIAQAPWTQPAVTALLTSRHPMTVGMVSPGTRGVPRRLSSAVTTLAEHMRASGRLTLGATANPNANAVFGFDQGFDAYFEPSHLWRGGMVKVDGAVLVDEVLHDLEKRGDGPFYLQLLLIDAHRPDTAGDDRARFVEAGTSDGVAGYRAMLHRWDDTIRALHEGLEALGHDERDTLFVVVGDHGEGLSTPVHHGHGHGRFLYESAVHVPWVLAGPGVKPGQVIEGLSAGIDLVPTLLGLLGSPPDPGAAGSDWSALARGRGDRTDLRRAYADTWFDGSRAAVYTEDLLCQRDYAPDKTRVREDLWRRRRGTELPPFRDGCFSRRDDPTSTSPFDDPALSFELDAWRHARSAEWATSDSQDAAVDAELARLLEALGYAD
jgi:arylsulfatase A-like enzyme